MHFALVVCTQVHEIDDSFLYDSRYDGFDFFSQPLALAPNLSKSLLKAPGATPSSLLRALLKARVYLLVCIYICMCIYI